MFERPEIWIQIGVYVATVVAAYFGLRQAVALLAQRVDQVESKVDEHSAELDKKFDRLEGVLVSMARTEERLARADEHILLLRKEFDDLKHGQGFINSNRLVNAGA